MTHYYIEKNNMNCHDCLIKKYIGQDEQNSINIIILKDISTQILHRFKIFFIGILYFVIRRIIKRIFLQYAVCKIWHKNFR